MRSLTKGGCCPFHHPNVGVPGSSERLNIACGPLRGSLATNPARSTRGGLPPGFTRPLQRPCRGGLAPPSILTPPRGAQLRRDRRCRLGQARSLGAAHGSPAPAPCPPLLSAGHARLNTVDVVLLHRSNSTPQVIWSATHRIVPGLVPSSVRKGGPAAASGPSPPLSTDAPSARRGWDRSSWRHPRFQGQEPPRNPGRFSARERFGQLTVGLPPGKPAPGEVGPR